MAHDDLPETEADLRPVEAPRSTRLAARYSLGKTLGEGGMGEVLACRDVVLDRTVALKVVRRDRAAKHYEARFIREARVQAQLEHPGVVPVFDVGRDENNAAYFTMRKVSGKTLDELLDVLREGKPNPVFDRHRLLTAFGQLCLTVDYAHSRGVLHRDLKPANVMLGEFGEVYALDWGLAKVAIEPRDSSQPPVTPKSALETEVGATMGTPAYMAPEQFAGFPLDPRADVFALGAILFEIVTLEPLLDEKAIRSRLRREEATWDARPSVRAPGRDPPPEFDRILQRATSPEREKRYPTARALHDAVEAYLQGERDTELRKSQAALHLTRARALIAGDKDAALVAVNRALGLAPDDPDALAILVEILASSPTPTAHDREEVAHAQVERLRKTQPLGALLFTLPWLTVYPLFLWLRGVRNLPLALVPPLLWVIAGAAIMQDYRDGSQARVRYPTILVMLATASSTLIVGPFFLLPGLAAAAVASHLMIGARVHHRTTIVAGVAALVVPSVLAWTGVDPVYRFIGEGTFEVHGIFRTIHHAAGLGVLVTATHVILVVSVVMYSTTFRDSIDSARTESALFAWQLGKLLPTNFTAIDVSHTDPAPRSQPLAAADTELDGTPPELATTTDTGDHADQPGHDPLFLEGARYDVGGPIGHEGNSELRICHDRLVGRDVLMKMAHADRNVFVREALLQARLDHPSIPSVYDASDEWMTMKHSQGQTLAGQSRVAGSRHRLLNAFAQVCLTIDFAHAQRIAHRALDSSRVVLGDFGEIWVVDWSQARTLLPGEGDEAEDARGLGGMLFQILTGKSPADGDPAKPSGYALEVPPELDALCKRAADGLASARELHDGVTAHLGGDRDETLRTKLAEEHLARARRRIEKVLVNHDESAREDALFELGRAIALAPDRGPALEQLSRLLERPPHPLPPSVLAAVDRQAWDTSQGAAPIAALAIAITWLVVYPFYCLCIGVRDPVKTTVVAVAWGLTALAIWIHSRYVPPTVRLPIPAIVGMLAVAATSLIFGPFLFMPTVALGAAMGFIVGARSDARRLIGAMAVLVILVPSALAIAGYTKTSEFDTSGPAPVVIVRGAVDSPPNGFQGTMLLANLCAILLSAAYAARFREVLDDVEARNRARLEQLSRLLS